MAELIRVTGVAINLLHLFKYSLEVLVLDYLIPLKWHVLHVNDHFSILELIHDSIHYIHCMQIAKNGEEFLH